MTKSLFAGTLPAWPNRLTPPANICSGKAEGKAEGVIEGERRLLLRLASQRFGAPPDAALKRLQSINDADELSQAPLKLSSASGWQDLLGD